MSNYMQNDRSSSTIILGLKVKILFGVRARAEFSRAWDGRYLVHMDRPYRDSQVSFTRVCETI
jgi:hypothetical protein